MELSWPSLGERRAFHLPWDGGIRRFDFPLRLVTRLKSLIANGNEQSGSSISSIDSQGFDGSSNFIESVSASPLLKSLELDDSIIPNSSLQFDERESSEPPLKRRRKLDYAAPDDHSTLTTANTVLPNLDSLIKLEPIAERKIVELKSLGRKVGDTIPHIRGYLKQSQSWKDEDPYYPNAVFIDGLTSYFTQNPREFILYFQQVIFQHKSDYNALVQFETLLDDNNDVFADVIRPLRKTDRYSPDPVTLEKIEYFKKEYRNSELSELRSKEVDNTRPPEPPRTSSPAKEREVSYHHRSSSISPLKYSFSSGFLSLLWNSSSPREREVSYHGNASSKSRIPPIRGIVKTWKETEKDDMIFRDIRWNAGYEIYVVYSDPPFSSKSDLKAYFSQIGPVREVTLGGGHSHTAWIEFFEKEHAQKLMTYKNLFDENHRTICRSIYWSKRK